MVRRIPVLACVLVIGLIGSLRADSYPCYSYGGSYGYLPENLPYFAVYPPVYYSHIDPRPYGQSPFAWPPQPMVTAERPLELSSPPASEHRQPLRIVNPFVNQVDPSFPTIISPSATPALVPPPPRPGVVHPTQAGARPL